VEFAGREEVETTTLDSLMNTFGAPYYIKVDVEGHEPSVLRGLKRPVPFLSFEVNLPEFLPEGIECVEILTSLCENGRFNWSGDCQGGFALSDWLGGPDFIPVLRRCGEASVEVFWRTPTEAAPPPAASGQGP